ncbi:uncharacterized protein LOC142491263 isoform X3 [Ascaphus truei]|uniref:uncharacterized protein LOC142491263 isoform X3 n=1 Tax=Ascaphus truei TaxID=8439 RepID=UPI003F598D7A
MGNLITKVLSPIALLERRALQARSVPLHLAQKLPTQRPTARAPLSPQRAPVRCNLAPVIVHPAFPYHHRMDIIGLPFRSKAESKCPPFIPSRPPVSSYLFPADGCAKETALGVLRKNARMQNGGCAENPSSGSGDCKKSEEELKEPSTSTPAVTQGETHTAEHGSAPDIPMENKSSGPAYELYNTVWLTAAWCGEQLIRLLTSAAGQGMAKQQVGTLQGPVKNSSPSGLETTMDDCTSDSQVRNSKSTRSISSACSLGTCTHGIRLGPHNAVTSSHSSSVCLSQLSRRIVTLSLGSSIASSLGKSVARGTQQPRVQMLLPHKVEEHRGETNNKGVVKPRSGTENPQAGVPPQIMSALADEPTSKHMVRAGDINAAPAQDGEVTRAHERGRARRNQNQGSGSGIHRKQDPRDLLSDPSHYFRAPPQMMSSLAEIERPRRKRSVTAGGDKTARVHEGAGIGAPGRSLDWNVLNLQTEFIKHAHYYQTHEMMDVIAPSVTSQDSLQKMSGARKRKCPWKIKSCCVGALPSPTNSIKGDVRGQEERRNTERSGEIPGKESADISLRAASSTEQSQL